MHLTIDPEFKALIPPLAEQELAGLDASLKAEGCRDALVVWREKSILLDGHNRFEICRKNDLKFSAKELSFPDRDRAKIWIITNQFARRNLTDYARGELALKLEPLLAVKAKENQREHGGTAPGRSATLPKKSAEVKASSETREQLAKIAGVSHDTIAKVKFVSRHADEETKKSLRDPANKKKLNAVHKRLKDETDQESRKAKRSAAAKDAPLNASILHGDFRARAADIPDGSLSLIFTDPPYDREASKMLPDLAVFAAAKLAEGGSLICYAGQTQLLAALDAFRPHLRYWWTIACLHAGRSTVMRKYGIDATWKPVLWFVKGTRDNLNDMVRDSMSGGEEKEFHDWGQAESEAAYWIKHLCPTDGIVCDPFLGGGTTAAAAEKLGRKWIGIEIDKDQISIVSKRIAA